MQLVLSVKEELHGCQVHLKVRAGFFTLEGNELLKSPHYSFFAYLLPHSISCTGAWTLHQILRRGNVLLILGVKSARQMIEYLHN